MDLKIRILLLGLCLSISTAFAQWVSPGDGTTYTLSDLATLPASGVTETAPGVYHLAGDMVISTGDALQLEAAVHTFTLGDTVTLEIDGTLQCEARTEPLLITGNADGTAHYNIRFDNATPTTLAQIHFEHGEKIMLMESHLTFQCCTFSGFASEALSLLNSNPQILDCHFYENRSAAIGSAANLTSAPVIRNCRFYNNVLDNVNKPQINLGPGTANDTIRIEGNHIEGVASDMSGGIGIMNAYGLPTTLIVRGNTIVSNRYGFTQTGTAITAIIEDNIIKDNNISPDTLNGGSGISIFGYAENCSARIRRNLITGNVWGVTAIYIHSTDLGTSEDPGGNVIYRNGKNGNYYELYNNSYSCGVSAVGNYWGDNDALYAENVIYHQADDAALGLVTYLPIMNLEPEIMGYAVPADLNPVLGDAEPVTEFGAGDTIFIHFPAGSAIPTAPLVPVITLPLGVSCTPESGEAQYFTDHIVYAVSTPHGTSRNWSVVADIEETVAERAPLPVRLYPNPVAEDHFTVASESEGELQVVVCNVLGQQIAAVESRDATITLSTATWERGTYFVTVRQNGGQRVFKTVVL